MMEQRGSAEGIFRISPSSISSLPLLLGPCWFLFLLQMTKPTFRQRMEVVEGPHNYYHLGALIFEVIFEVRSHILRSLKPSHKCLGKFFEDLHTL